MRIRKNNKKRKIATLCITLLTLIVCAALYFYFSYSQDNNPINSKTAPTGTISYDEPSKSEINAATDIKDEDDNKNQETDKTGDSNKSIDQELSAFITLASGNPLRIRVLINELVSSGTCNLLVKNSSGIDVYSAEATITNLPSSSSCAGFNVTETLPSGDYTIIIDIMSENNKSVRLTKEVNL